MKKLLLTASIALACMTGHVHAETLSLDVKAGKKTLIYTYSVYDQLTCRSGAPAKVTRQEAKNGTLSYTRGGFIAGEGPCKGERLTGTSIYYTPNRGFRGKDKALFILRTNRAISTDIGYTFRKIKYNLNVK